MFCFFLDVIIPLEYCSLPGFEHWSIEMLCSRSHHPVADCCCGFFQGGGRALFVPVQHVHKTCCLSSRLATFFWKQRFPLVLGDWQLLSKNVQEFARLSVGPDPVNGSNVGQTWANLSICYNIQLMSSL